MRNVLAVEDEALLLQAITAALASLPDVTVTGVSSVGEALRAIEERPPDLLLSDLSLPDGTGIELVQRLEQLGQHIPIIVQTGQLSLFRQAIADYSRLVILEKPLSMKELRNHVSAQLGEAERGRRIDPFGLIDYLQLASFSRRSLLLAVRLVDGSVGQLAIVGGDAHSARLDELDGPRRRGLDAIEAMMRSAIASLDIDDLHGDPGEREIKLTTHGLLLELARVEDETRSGRSSSGESGVYAGPSAGDFDDFDDLDDLDDSAKVVPLARARSSSPTPTPTPPQATREQELNIMSNVNKVCEKIVDDVQDALACGVVDLNTGMLMGVHHTVAYFTQSYLDAVAAAAVDMFRGKNVKRVEKLVSQHRGKEITDAFEEIFVSSPGVFHFMKALKGKGAVVVLVTRKTTNQGLGWASLRIACDDIIAALP
jgi:DNA-binding response OmpR family regulator